MGNISKIVSSSGNEYDIKDLVARNGLNGKQNTLVSGENIKTINNTSLLGSGDITVAIKARAVVTLTAAGWSNGAQTVSVSGVTASNDVVVASAPANAMEYGECRVFCTAQGAGTLTFTCAMEPESDLQVNVLILE